MCYFTIINLTQFLPMYSEHGIWFKQVWNEDGKVKFSAVEWISTALYRGYIYILFLMARGQYFLSLHERDRKNACLIHFLAVGHLPYIQGCLVQTVALLTKGLEVRGFSQYLILFWNNFLKKHHLLFSFYVFWWWGWINSCAREVLNVGYFQTAAVAKHTVTELHVLYCVTLTLTNT